MNLLINYLSNRHKENRGNIVSRFPNRIDTRVKMYYDDPYDPNLPNDYDEDYGESTYNQIDSNSISDEDDDTLDSQKLRKKKFEDLKNIDRGYVKARINAGHNKITVEYYKTTNTLGTKIRNALMGIYENYRVGRKDEDLFFKVVSTVVKDSNGESHLLFYDSPEQYEKHFQCEVSDKIKRKWLEKSSSARDRLIQEAKARHDRESVVIR